VSSRQYSRPPEPLTRPRATPGEEPPGPVPIYWKPSVIKMNVRTHLILILTLLAVAGALQAADHKEALMEPEHHRAQWMADGSYGVMVHYFPAPSGDSPEARTADFSRMIDGFECT